MGFKCPNCQTVLYNRALRLCSTCGATLPPEFLLPEPQLKHFEEQAERELKADRAAESNVRTTLEVPDVPTD